MASWGSFALGFFAGLCAGEATLGFFLAAVRKDRTVELGESPPLLAEHEMTSNDEVSAHKETVARASFVPGAP
jgi:hypothetical protein